MTRGQQGKRNYSDQCGALKESEGEGEGGQGDKKETDTREERFNEREAEVTKTRVREEESAMEWGGGWEDEEVMNNSSNRGHSPPQGCGDALKENLPKPAGEGFKFD